jgi:ankyrin repeat protein
MIIKCKCRKCCPNYLIHQINDNNINGILFALENEIYENEIDRGDGTCCDKDFALMTMVMGNNTKIVKILLDFGVSINIFDGFLLVVSCDNNNIVMTKLLLDYGIDIHQRNGQALISCVYNNNLKMIHLLIEYGANINIRDDESLVISVKKGYIDLFKALIVLGCDVHCQNDTPIIESIKNGHIEIFKIIINEYSTIIRQKIFVDALNEAVKYQQTDIVKILISYTNFNKQNLNDALTFINTSKSFEIIKLLIESGADIHYNNEYILRKCIGHFGNYDLIKFLLIE